MNRKLTGYCTRCGGDCFDDGQRSYHRCPQKRVEADAVVALKFACDEARNALERRPWAEIVRKEDLGDLRTALQNLDGALRRAYP